MSWWSAAMPATPWMFAGRGVMSWAGLVLGLVLAGGSFWWHARRLSGAGAGKALALGAGLGASAVALPVAAALCTWLASMSRLVEGTYLAALEILGFAAWAAVGIPAVVALAVGLPAAVWRSGAAGDAPAPTTTHAAVVVLIVGLGLCGQYEAGLHAPLEVAYIGGLQGEPVSTVLLRAGVGLSRGWHSHTERPPAATPTAWIGERYASLEGAP